MNDNNLQNDDNNQRQAEQNGGLDDLSLTAEELDGIKGGCGPFHKDEPERPVGGGMFINNHNETVVSDEALLADLEPVEEVKGGSETALSSVTDLIIDPFNRDRVLAGSQHSAGINVCMMDGSVR